MPRPCCLRHVGVRPCAAYFKPAGIPSRLLEQIVLTLDELEALRLADLEGLYQEDAARRMNISRTTFSRVVEQARRKVATALIQGKALRLEGGAIVMKDDAASEVHEGAPRQQPSGRCAAQTQGRLGKANQRIERDKEKS